MSKLTICPDVRLGFYRFAIDEQDITPLIDMAFMQISYRPGQGSKLRINTKVVLPDDKEAILFIGEKPNGFNRSN